MLARTLLGVLCALVVEIAALPTAEQSAGSYDIGFDDILTKGVPGGFNTMPTLYRGLSWSGWNVTLFNPVPATHIVAHSAPNVAFIATRVSMPQQANAGIDVGSTVKSFSLSSLYSACGMDVYQGQFFTLDCHVRAVGTKTDGTTVETTLTVPRAPTSSTAKQLQLFTFPATFSSLKSVRFYVVESTTLEANFAWLIDNLKYQANSY